MYEITYLDIEENPEYEQIIKDVIKECYKEEHLENSKLTVQITLTNPENIRKYNKEYRNILQKSQLLLNTGTIIFPLERQHTTDKVLAHDNHPCGVDGHNNTVYCSSYSCPRKFLSLDFYH